MERRVGRWFTPAQPMIPLQKICSDYLPTAAAARTSWARAHEDEFSDKSGRSMVNCCAMRPPIENPRASTFLMPSASMKTAACCCHLFNRSRHFTAGTGDAGVVEQDHFAALGKSVGQRGIPVIHGPGRRPTLGEYTARERPGDRKADDEHASGRKKSAADRRESRR